MKILSVAVFKQSP